MKTYRGVDVLIHIFLTSAQAGGDWSASRLGRFTPGEKAPGTHWIGGWVGPRAGLDYMEKWKILTPPGLEFRPLSRPASSQSLYRLRYPGSGSISNSFQLNHSFVIATEIGDLNNYETSRILIFSFPSSSNLLRTCISCGRSFQTHQIGCLSLR
jgi:hypothetical protein